MVGIPPVYDADAEDVAWALQTAEALWKRNERLDAIVWLRRAAQAAGEAEDDDRALALARGAAELSEWLARNPTGSESRSVPPPTASTAATAGEAIDDLLRASQVDPQELHATALPSDLPVDVEEEAVLINVETSAPPQPLQPASDATDEASTLPPAAVEAIDEPTDDIHDDDEADTDTGVSERAIHVSHVPSAAEKHAGMLDPWADAEVPVKNVAAAHARGAIPPPRANDAFDPEEVVTSAPVISSSSKQRAARAVVPPLPSEPSLKAAPPAAPAKPTAPEPATPAASQPAVSKPPIKPPALESLVRPKAAEPPPKPAVSKPVIKPVAPPAPVRPSPSQPPAKPALSKPPIKPVAPPAPIQPPASKPPAKPSTAPTAGVDLSNVEAFADLPDDVRLAFAMKASVQKLARDEEVSGFALAFVIEGEVDLAATIVDAPAVRLAAGRVLRSHGTIEHVTPIRLIGGSDTARVATWDEASVTQALGGCPWVEDDLLAAGDRYQAEVGITMGPLGERLDLSLRADLTRRLTLRVLAENETCATRGKPLSGLVVVGAGELEVVDEHDAAVGPKLRAGDFVFPNEVLRAAPAPQSVRAAKGGALLLFAERGAAQELLLTCPPLLEIFADG